MAKVDYASSAAQIVELVGGTENVSKVTHCITRVRFVLKDGAVAHDNVEAVKAVPGVIQVVEAGGQYQVVIGTAVAKMYDEVVAITGNAGGEVAADEGQDDAEGEKASPIQRLIKMISAIVIPCLGAMIGCGIISSLATLLVVVGACGLESDTYIFLSGLGQACIYFFPVLAGMTAAKYFGMEQVLGGVIGAALMYPVVNNAELAGTTAHLFGFLPVTYQAYNGAMFPAIAAVAFGSVIYKFLKKHMPDMISFFMVPTLTLLVTVPVALAVIAPVMMTLSGVISAVIMGIYNFSPILCGIVLNAVWLPVVVPMGLHQALGYALYMQLFTEGSSPALGLLCGGTALSGVLFGVWAKSKKADTKQLAASTAVTNILGISEPGLYGIVMQHTQTLLALSLAGAVTGIIPAVFGTAQFTLGASGIFGLPTYLNPNGDMSSFIGAVITEIAALVVGFLVTYFWPNFDPDKQ